MKLDKKLPHTPHSFFDTARQIARFYEVSGRPLRKEMRAPATDLGEYTVRGRFHAEAHRDVQSDLADYAKNLVEKLNRGVKDPNQAYSAQVPAPVYVDASNENESVIRVFAPRQVTVDSDTQDAVTIRLSTVYDPDHAKKTTGRAAIHISHTTKSWDISVATLPATVHTHRKITLRGGSSAEGAYVSTRGNEVVVPVKPKPGEKPVTGQLNEGEQTPIMIIAQAKEFMSNAMKPIESGWRLQRPSAPPNDLNSQIAAIFG